MRMLALLYMFLHELNYLTPLFFYTLDVLLVLDFVLFSTHFIADFLHGIGIDLLELLLDLLLVVTIPFFNLG